MPKTHPQLADIAQGKAPRFQAQARRQLGALCHRMSESGALEVLLITTRQSRRWTIPKGWAMPGKSDHFAAKQEALEEAGVVGKVSKKAFGHFTYLKFLADGQQVPCVVNVHLLRVERSLAKFKEYGQRDIVWCSCFEAALKVDEPELKALFKVLHECPPKLFD